jgi:hypothetical protein
MIIHHIRPFDIAMLMTMFQQDADTGIVIPVWLTLLQDTAIDPQEFEDFETTRPRLQHMYEVRSHLPGKALAERNHSQSGKSTQKNK